MRRSIGEGARPRQSAAEDRDAVGMAPRRGEERGAVGLTQGAHPGWESSRGWLDVVTGAGSVQAVVRDSLSGHGPRAGCPGASPTACGKRAYNNACKCFSIFLFLDRGKSRFIESSKILQ
jgi:hypothetical protein